jgi:hypothetical protein
MSDLDFEDMLSEAATRLAHAVTDIFADVAALTKRDNALAYLKQCADKTDEARAAIDQANKGQRDLAATQKAHSEQLAKERADHTEAMQREKNIFAREKEAFEKARTGLLGEAQRLRDAAQIDAAAISAKKADLESRLAKIKDAAA